MVIVLLYDDNIYSACPQTSSTGFWPDPFFLVPIYCFFEMYKSYRSNNYFGPNCFISSFKKCISLLKRNLLLLFDKIYSFPDAICQKSKTSNIVLYYINEYTCTR